MHNDAMNIVRSKATCADFRYEYLPKVNREKLLEDVNDLQFPNVDDLNAWELFKKQASSAVAYHLTPELQELLVEFSRPDGPDAIVIDGLPVDPDLPPTPADGRRPVNKAAVSEAVMAGIVGQMDHEILSYKQEKQGVPFHEVVPIVGHETVQSNAGSVPFDAHSDNSHIHTRYRQENLCLFGIRNEKDVSTRFITLEDIKKALPPELLQELRQPNFRLSAPASFDLSKWKVLTEPRPIIRTNDYGIDCIAMSRGGVHPDNAKAKSAFKRFLTALDTIEPRRVVISPGRFTLFKDYRLLHGRDAVSGDRWLQRVYTRQSLALLRAATNSDPREFSFDVRLLMMG